MWGGALLAGASLGLAKYPSQLKHRPCKPLRVLDERQFAVMAAVAARIVQAPLADPAAIAHRVDDALLLQVPEVQRDIKKLLDLFENALAGALLDFRFKPFTRLSGSEQDRVLVAWRDSRLAVRRGGYLALRKLAASNHYHQPETWADLGYPGPPKLPA